MLLRPGMLFVSYLLLAFLFYFHALLSPWINGCAFDNMLAIPYLIRAKDLISLFLPSCHAVTCEDEYHPLVTVIYFIWAHCGGDNPLGIRFLNLAMISSCSTLVCLSGAYLLKKRLWAFFAGLFFLTHTINMEPMISPDMNADLIMTFFVLMAFFGHLQNRTALVVFGYTAGLLSKETAIVLPALLVCHDLLLSPARFRTLKKHVRNEYVSLLAVSVGYLFLNLFIINRGLSDIARPMILQLGFLRSTQNLIAAFRFLFLPMLTFLKPGPIGYITTVVVLTGIALLAVRLTGRRWPLFCLSWIVISLLPVLGLVPVKKMTDYFFLIMQRIGSPYMSRRYLFLAAPVFCWLLASLGDRLSRKRNKFLISFSYCLAILFCLSSILAGGVALFSDKALVNNRVAEIVSPRAEGLGFKSPLFAEVVLPSLPFIRRQDPELFLRIRRELSADFSQDEIGSILGFFSTPLFHRDSRKVNTFFRVRKLTDPHEFMAALRPNLINR